MFEVKRQARGQMQENWARETEVGQSKDESRAQDKSEDRDRDRDEDRDKDKGQGKDIESRSIYSGKMNK
jgi:hypothetical protein